MTDHPEGDDDPFERAVARERELQDQLDGGVRLGVDDVKRIVEEGVDPDLVRDILDLHLDMSLADILDLLVDYGPDLDFFEELDRLGVVDRRDAERLLDNGVSPADVVALREAGLAVSVREAVEIAEEGGDLEALAEAVRREDLADLTAEQIRRLVGEGIELDDLARLREAGLGLTVDDAIDLAGQGVDPEVVARLAGSDHPMSASELRNAVREGGPSVNIGLSFRTGHTQQAWGAGRQRVSRDGRVRGVWLGTLRVLPGVHADIDALVIGDVVVGRGADVTVRGTVTGDVRNSGGRVSISGRVGGDVVEEADEAHG